MDHWSLKITFWVWTGLNNQDAFKVGAVFPRLAQALALLPYKGSTAHLPYRCGPWAHLDLRPSRTVLFILLKVNFKLLKNEDVVTRMPLQNLAYQQVLGRVMRRKEERAGGTQSTAWGHSQGRTLVFDMNMLTFPYQKDLLIRQIQS